MSGSVDTHICIGSPRSGTTWLFNCLKQNPEVFLPAIREIGYWWGGPSGEQKQGMLEAVSAEIADDKTQQEWFRLWMQADDQSAEGYQKLMHWLDKSVVDISLSYCLMPVERIEAMKEAISENSKVFIFLRNPLERSLASFELHAYMHGMFRGPATLGTFADFVNSHIQRAWANYEAIVGNWKSVFGDRFKIFYYDDLEADPAKFLKSLYDYLGLDAGDKQSLKSAAEMFEAEVKQSAGSIFPKIQPDQRSYFATQALEICDNFTLGDPGIVDAWKVAIAKYVSLDTSFQPRPREVDVNYERFTRMTESLGDNCEFGFFQRHQGYEPSSLFRWAISPAESVINYLRSPMELFIKENLEVVDSDLVYDRGSHLHFHTDLMEFVDGVRQFVEPEMFEKIYAREKAKIEFLTYKFFHNLRMKPAVYVAKENGGLSRETALELLAALRSYNPEHQLIMVTSSEEYFARKTDDGLFHATVPRFADYSAANLIEQPSWTRLITDISRHPDIARMVETMFR